jgi:OFA family oxalate/formate antiporter-like MFS transporter
MKSNFGKKGWWIIIFTLLIYMFTCAVPDTLNVVTGGFAHTFGMSSDSPLLVFSAIGGFVGIPLALIAGHIISRKGVKGPAVVMMFALAVLWFFYGRCATLQQFAVVATIITALSNTVNLVVTQQLMSNWFPKKKGLALGWATMGMPLDSAITVAVFQVLLTKVGFAAPFYMMVAIMAILAVVMILAVKSYPEEAGAFPDNEEISEEEKKANMELFSHYQSDFTVGKLFRTPAFWLLVIVFGFLFIGLVGTISQMVPRMVSIGFSPNTAVMWLTIASLIGIPASYLWGLIDQAAGTKKTVVIFTVIWAVMMLLSSLGCSSGSHSLTITSVVIFACLNGGLGNLMPSMCISVFGRFDFAQANKLMVPFVVGIRTLAFLIIPGILMAAGKNVSGGFARVFLVFTVLAVIALIASVFLPKESIGRESTL